MTARFIYMLSQSKIRVICERKRWTRGLGSSAATRVKMPSTHNFTLDQAPQAAFSTLRDFSTKTQL